MLNGSRLYLKTIKCEKNSAFCSITNLSTPPGVPIRVCAAQRGRDFVACVASVSVRFRSKERGTRVKDRATNGSRFISRSVKTENPLPRSFFAPKPNGNACYAGYDFEAPDLERGIHFKGVF